MSLDIIITTPVDEEMVSNSEIQQLIISLFYPKTEEELLGNTTTISREFQERFFSLLELQANKGKYLNENQDLSFVQAIERIYKEELYHKDSSVFKEGLSIALDNFCHDIISYGASIERDEIDVLIEELSSILYYLEVLKYPDEQVTFEFWI